MNVQEPSEAIAIGVDTDRTGESSLIASARAIFGRVGAWAVDTAQQFGVLVSALMAPAVFSAYAMTAWSLTSNLGWTNSFLFASGPLSNWLIWLGIAVSLHIAAEVLRRRTLPGE